MKNLLIATTALVAVAGMASADITITGHAAAGYHSDLDAKGSSAASTTDAGIYSNVGVDFKMTGATDNGISFGATLNIDAGTEIDQGDFEFDGNDSGTAGLGNVFLTSGATTLTFDNNGIDNMYDSDFSSHDVSISTTVNGVSISAGIDADDSVAGGAAAAAEADMSGKIGYTSGSLTTTLTGSNHAVNGMASKLALSYVVNDMLTIGGSTKTGATNAADKAVATLSATVVANGLTIKMASDNSTDVVDGKGDWDLDLGYTLSGVTLDYGTDEKDAWAATASMGLGGGASVKAGLNWEDSMYAGISFAF